MVLPNDSAAGSHVSLLETHHESPLNDLKVSCVAESRILSFVMHIILYRHDQRHSLVVDSPRGIFDRVGSEIEILRHGLLGSVGRFIFVDLDQLGIRFGEVLVGRVRGVKMSHSSLESGKTSWSEIVGMRTPKIWI